MTRQFLLLAVLRFSKLGLAVASLIAYGRVFGVSLSMDAWVFASGVIASAGMLAWGPVNEIVRSRFLQNAARDGFEAAAKGATRLMRVTAVGSVALALFLWAAGPWLISMLYSGANRDGDALLLQVFALMLPSLVLGQMLALSSAYLNCCNVIYAPEWIGIASGMASLACVVTLVAPLGVLALVVAHYLSLLTSLAWTWLLLRRRRFLGAPLQPFAGLVVRDYLHFAAPLYLSYAAGQANAVLERSLATSLGVGTVSSVNYAAQIKSTLQAVVSSVLFSLAVPKLTRAAAESDESGFAQSWLDVQRVVAIFMIAVLPPVWGGADLIAAVLFGASKLGPEQKSVVVDLIRSYSLALLPVVLYLVHGSALLARQRGRTYAAWGVASQILSGACSLALVSRIGPHAFPVALLLSHGVSAVAMAWSVGRSRPLWLDLLVWLPLLVLAALVSRAVMTVLAARLDAALLALVVGTVVHGLLVGAGLWGTRIRRRRLT